MSRNELVMKKLTLMGIGVFLMTAIVTTAHADNTSSVHHDIALEGIAVVEISNSVGSIHVLPSRDGDLHIDVELENADSRNNLTIRMNLEGSETDRSTDGLELTDLDSDFQTYGKDI